MRETARRRAIGGALTSARGVALALSLCGCNLHGFNNGSGGAINLAVAGDYVLSARGRGGLDVVDARTGDRVGHADPQGESDSFDDVAVDGAQVVALDADSGRLSTFALTPDGALVPRSRDHSVDASPYSGVSLAAGRVVVSGGICGVTSFALSGDGALSARGALRASRGQPEVTMLPDGRGALLSTHFSGSRDEFVDGAEFGVSTLRLDPMAVVHTLGLSGAGFTEGGGRPASWPVRATLDGDLAYIAHGGGMDVVRVGATLTMVRVSRTALPMSAVDVAVRDRRAWVVGAAPATLVELDVANPARPVIARRYALSEPDARPSAVAVTADAVFIAGGPAGLIRRPR